MISAERMMTVYISRQDNYISVICCHCAVLSLIYLLWTALSMSVHLCRLFLPRYTASKSSFNRSKIYKYNILISVDLSRSSPFLPQKHINKTWKGQNSIQLRIYDKIIISYQHIYLNIYVNFLFK